MFCSFCGKEIPNNSNFCPNCGKQQGSKPMGNDWWNKYVLPFYKSHKIVSTIYMMWLLIHLTLFIFSSPSKSRGGDYLTGGFYPFSDSLSYIFGGGTDYSFSLLKNINVYDFSEFFFYTIFIPLFAWGILQVWKQLFKNIKKRKFDGTNKVNETSAESENASESLVEEDKKEYVASEQQTDNTEIRPFSLIRRFVGSMIDKTIIVILFLTGYVCSRPYAGPGEIGTIMGLNSSSPSVYRYIDKDLIDRYGTYYEGIDKEYQDKLRLEEDVPYDGYIRDFELRFFSIFILVNVLYYLFFEFIIHASLGKELLGGRLIEKSDGIAFFWKIILRGIMVGVLSLIVLLGVRYGLELNYFWVVAVFFLILDLPLLFTKRSLIDLSTGTMYIYHER